MAQFAVIGLGRFGSAASLELMKLGHSVLGVDTSEKLVNKYADQLTHAVIADVKDRRAIEELGLDNYDVVLVGIGSELEASLLCVVHLKSAGVKKIWVKATSQAHHSILGKLGVDRIIHPEEEMGIRVAQALSYPMVKDYISLGNGQFVVEIDVGDRLDGTTVQQLLVECEEDIHILIVKRKADMYFNPGDAFALHTKDILVIAGKLEALKSIAPLLT